MITKVQGEIHESATGYEVRLIKYDDEKSGIPSKVIIISEFKTDNGKVYMSYQDNKTGQIGVYEYHEAIAKFLE